MRSRRRHDGAVHDPVWITSDDEPPWTLVDLLTAITSRQRNLDERVARALAIAQERTSAEAVAAIAEGGQQLLDALGEPEATRLLHLAIHDRHPRDRIRWASAHPDLVLCTDRWWLNRTQRPVHERCGPPSWLLVQIRDLETELWREQARFVLDARLAIAHGDPRLHRLAGRLLDGELVTFSDIAETTAQPINAAPEQAEILAPYLKERANAVAAQHAALPRRHRRHTPVATLDSAYDAEHLTACRDCGSHIPRGPDTCPLCGGALDAWTQRQAVPSLTEILTAPRRSPKHKETTRDQTSPG